MTNPTPHGQVPEALRSAPSASYSPEDRAFHQFWYGHMFEDLMQPPLIGIPHSTARYIWDAALRAQQPASPTPPAEQQAAPKAAPAVLHEPTNEMYRAAQKIALPYDDDGGTIILNTSQIRAIWHAMLAASPPAEQQAAPKAAPVAQTAPAPGERCQHCIDRRDGVYGSWAAPCPYHDDDGKPRPTAKAAPQQEAQEPCPTCAALARTVMLDQTSFDRKPDCYGIRQITDDEGIEEWEDIRTSPDVAREEANDMMATGRGEIYEVVPLWATPQPAPAPLSDPRITAIEQAIRDYHYALDCRKHGGVAEGEAFGAICNAMKMDWVQGQESERRAAIAAQGGKDATMG